MKHKILDLIDFEKVNELLEKFYESTGFVTAIIDLEGNVLSKSPWRKICSEFHRKNPETAKKCIISDTELASKISKNQKYHCYECLNGLVDVAVPLVINGKHIANLFSGQFFIKEPDLDFFKKQADEYGFDYKEYLKAIKDVPVVTIDKVKVTMDFLITMAQIISDTTYQKVEQLQLTESLIKSEARYRSLLDKMLEGCQIIGFDWKYLYLNHAAEIQNRRPNSELLGNSCMDMWPGIENTEIFKVIKNSLEERVSNRFENEIIYPDGDHGWFDLSIQPVDEGVFILSIDITESKKAEIALKESEERYRLVSDSTNDWIYWIALDGNFLYISPSCELITGYSPEDFTNNPELYHKIIFKEDKEKVRNHSFYSVSDNDPHELEFRIITKDGELRWINHKCRPVIGKDGKILGRRGTNSDITVQKQEQEKLFENEYKFRTLYENGPFGMVLVDDNFRFIKTNQIFCNIIGYSEEELMNLSFINITHPDDIVKDLQNVKKLFNKEISVYKTEKRYIHKTGREVWGSLTVNTTYDSEGKFIYYLGVIEDITSRKLVEEEYKKLNERITTATHASHVGIWDWDIENNVLTWDEQMYSLYGLKKEEFSNAFDAWLNSLHPDDKEFSQNESRLALIGEKDYDTEFRIVLPDGTIRHVKSKGEVFRNESEEPVRMVGINYDITEQKLIAEKIREKDIKFRKLSANLPDLIFQFTRKPDGSYCVPIASEGIKNIFGCTPEDVIDDFGPIARVLFPDDTERIIRDIEYSAEHLTYFTCEFRVQIPGKPVQWIFSRSTPEKLPDGSITWYGFNADITYRKEAEEAIQKLNIELEQRVIERTSQLEYANKELEAFSYSVSHDLRAPLRHINGYVDLLKNRFKNDLPDKARYYLNNIAESAMRMGTLIDDLLQFSRAGNQEIQKTIVDMNILVSETLELIKPDIDNRNIIWNIHKLPSVLCDISMLKQVWFNLINNAVKYTIKEKRAEITIGFEETRVQFTFYVKDNGVGFDMKYSQKLFGVFQRLHSPADFKGTGIGLANVKRIIQKHNGKVWAQAELGKGATFFFTLQKINTNYHG